MIRILNIMSWVEYHRELGGNMYAKSQRAQAFGDHLCAISTRGHVIVTSTNLQQFQNEPTKE